MKNYDIAVVGSGMTGLLAACALGPSHLKIAVIDQRLPIIEWQDDGFDARVSAITLASQQIFINLGVWQYILQHRMSPFENMHVWDGMGGNTIRFSHADVEKKQLGFIIENRVIQASLFKQLQNYSNIEWIYPAQLEQMENHADKVILHLSNQERLSAQLAIGADGAESKLRQLAAIKFDSRDYGHHALISTVKTSLSHQQTAWQCFMPDGVLAFLPLSDPHTCSIVWSTTPQQAQDLLQLSASDFNHKLGAAFAMRLGKIVDSSKRFVFPLQMRHVKKYVVEHVALIGDAAHTIHPLAGQGVNLGFLDAAALVEVILTAQQKNRSIGSWVTLRRYERWRKGENTLMLGFVAALQKLFAQQTLPLTSLRHWGISLTDNFMPAKKFLMHRAMGLTGDLPGLAKTY